MKIKDIRIADYGPYKDWGLTLEGTTIVYGPNESGKTSLLRALRYFLFGHKRQETVGQGYVTLERQGQLYHVGRKGKELDFYPLGGASIQEEPAKLWWNGLDRKTYDRIFAITLEDMQGVNIFWEVEVRARFFGAEGGESFGTAMKDVQQSTAELLVGSATGKRRINRLMEQLHALDEYMQELGKQEDLYGEVQARLEQTTQKEKELVEHRQEWAEYLTSLDIILRAWDTYKRGEEAKQRMTAMGQEQLLERDAFIALDEEVKQAQEYMRVWRGKEEGLVPDNFDPDAQIGLYSQDIESLYQEIAKWSKLEKECAEGERYLGQVKQQLDLSRKMHMYWRNVEELPQDVDWFRGEQLASTLRSARDVYDQWKQREPQVPPCFDADADTARVDEETRIQEERSAIGELRQLLQDEGKLQEELTATITASGQSPLWKVFGLIVGLGGVFWMQQDFTMGVGAIILGVVFFLGAFFMPMIKKQQPMNTVKAKALEGLRQRLEAAKTQYKVEGLLTEDFLQDWSRQLDEAERAWRSDAMAVERHAYEKSHAQWVEEGKALEEKGRAVMDQWHDWLPAEASQVLRDDQFFGLKEEYDRYMERQQEYRGYVKRLDLHKEDLKAIVERGEELWHKLGITYPVSIVELRRIYQRLQLHKQNFVRWEQKEEQRRSYREEYAQWSKREKDLLLEQEELLQKAGVSSAVEYRRRLLAQDQYKQWETIYKQSMVQLDLLIPPGNHHDLIYRRLKGNDKLKWQSEYDRGVREKDLLERELASLYEERGTLQETLRTLSQSKDMTVVRQEKAYLEEELRRALEDWATHVYVKECMEQAQLRYEQEAQPRALELASYYVERLTEGRYGIDVEAIQEGVFLVDQDGQRLAMKQWSSGLADQVYLALRLSLSVSFAERTEPLPIILDDVLVRFDESRQRAALELLRDIGSQWQVLIFTCHEGTFKLAQGMEGMYSHEL